MEWRRHRPRSASYAIMESNYLFLDSHPQLETVFPYFSDYFEIVPGFQAVTHPDLNDEFNSFFSHYYTVKLGNTIVCYSEALGTNYHFYPAAVVVIGYESGRPIFIKKNGRGIIPHGEKTLREIIDDMPLIQIFIITYYCY